MALPTFFSRISTSKNTPTARLLDIENSAASLMSEKHERAPIAALPEPLGRQRAFKRVSIAATSCNRLSVGRLVKAG
jgi:hypothetical protein